MKISEARGNPKTLDVPIGSGVLSVTYLPAQYTVADLEEIQGRSEKERIRAVTELVVATITAWDLQDDDGVDVALDADVIRVVVPVHILVKVLEAVQKETAPSAEA